MKKIKIPWVVLMILLVLGMSGLVYAQQQRVLRVCQASTAPDILDPHLHHNIEIEDILRQVCEHLVDRDPDGKLIPSLATSWSLINDTTWQFTLRKGVIFHNGEVFDAKAVKFSIERILDPARKSPQDRLYESIDHVDIIDNHTVNIITKRLDVLLPNKISLFANIVPHTNSNGSDNPESATHPIGTGPFKFLGWVKGKEVVLIPNRTYWGQIPKIDRLVFYFIPDSQKQIDMLINGDLDIVSNVSPLSGLDLKKTRLTTVIKKPTIQYIAFQMNTIKDGPLKDRNVRMALNYCIDTSKLIKYVYKGNGKQLATITMPEEFGFNPILKPYPYDIDRAKKIMLEAGHPNGFEITLLTFKDLETLGIAVKNQLATLGIKVKMVFISRSDYIKGITNDSLDFDVVLGNPTDPYFDASFQLGLLCSSKSLFSRYRNAEIDSLLAEANITMDMERREGLLRRAQEIIHKEVPFVFLFQVVKLYGVRKSIAFIPFADGLLRLKDLTN